MISEAIILAGGLGTRLRSVVSDAPKCMAPVSGQPFLNFLISFLKKNGIENFIFSVGYMHEVIEDYLKKEHTRLNYTVSPEVEPLGTGGAIKLACSQASGKNVLVVNGDTLFTIDGRSLGEFHDEKNAACTLCLKPLNNFDRYGVVELNDDQSVRSFKEKQFYQQGLINGGVYALDAVQFLKEDLPDKFSFEKEYLEKNVHFSNHSNGKLYGLVQDEYFIDIGIPGDYERAQKEISLLSSGGL